MVLALVVGLGGMFVATTLWFLGRGSARSRPRSAAGRIAQLRAIHQHVPKPLPPENPPPIEPDEVNVGLLGVVGTFLAVVVVLIVVLLQAWFYNWRASIAQERTLPSDSPRDAAGPGDSSNSGRLSAATTGSIGRRKCGRFPSSGRWNWWPTKWPPHRSPWRSRPRNEVDHDGHWFAEVDP